MDLIFHFKIGWDCVEVILNSGIRSIRMKKCPRATLICIQRTAAPRLVGFLHKKAQGAELERPSGRWVLPLRWGWAVVTNKKLNVLHKMFFPTMHCHRWVVIVSPDRTMQLVSI